MLRSATSIGANVEEAIGAFTKREFAYKMSIALKEARETNYWLRLVRDSKISKDNLDEYVEKSEELRKILTAIVKNPGEIKKTFLILHSKFFIKP